MLFRAKTKNSSTIKTLIELIYNNIKESYITLSKKGIYLINTDRKLLFEFTLFSHQFDEYEFNHKTDLDICLNFTHLYTLLRNIKKKDILEIFMEEKEKVGIKTITDNKKTISFITTNDGRKINIPSPIKMYTSFIVVPSNAYSDMCKSLNNIDTVVRVQAGNNQIAFHCEIPDLFSRTVVFGKELEKDEDYTYDQQFLTESLTRIQKIAGLAITIRVSAKTNLPLLLQSDIGDIGLLNIFLQNKSQLEKLNSIDCVPSKDEKSSRDKFKK